MNPTKLILSAALVALPTLAIAKPPHGEGHREQMRELLGEIKERSPERYNRLMELRRVDPEGFRKAMKKIHSRFGGGPDFDDPAMRAQKEKMRELREDARDLLESYKAAAGEEKPSIRNDLKSLAAEIFDARQSHRKMRLDKIRQHVEDLENEIQDLADNREDWIESWVNKKTEAPTTGR
jgi:gas vesicle protein